HQVAGTRRIVAIAHQHIREARIVYVRHAEHVSNVEEIEDFGDWFNLDAVADLERPGKTQIKRTKVIVEASIGRHQWKRRGLTSNIRGIKLLEESIQF